MDMVLHKAIVQHNIQILELRTAGLSSVFFRTYNHCLDKVEHSSKYIILRFTEIIQV